MIRDGGMAEYLYRQPGLRKVLRGKFGEGARSHGQDGQMRREADRDRVDALSTIAIHTPAHMTFSTIHIASESEPSARIRRLGKRKKQSERGSM